MKKLLGSFWRPLTPVNLLVFIVLFAFASCQKNLSFETAGPGAPPTTTPAKGSLKDASGNCIPAVVHGTWYNGVKPGDTNYVAITVNVTTAGSYRIVTDVNNGMYLGDSGVFTATGPNTVHLHGSPKSFVNHTSTNFNYSFDNTSCSFSINVQDSTGHGPVGGDTGGGTTSPGGTVDLNTWRFTANGHTYTGTATASVTDAPAIPGVSGAFTLFAVVGQTPNSSDTLFSLAAKMNGTAVAKGTYKTSTIPTQWSFSTVNLINNTTTILFSADPSTSGKVINIVITDYDAATQTVTGTFDGTSKSTTGAAVTISGSAFKVSVM